MKDKNNFKINLLAGIACVVFLLSSFISSAQEQTYYPRGNPDKWNVELTPFLWLPWITGKVDAHNKDESVTIGPVDLLSKLKMAFMINAEVSKGKWFVSPTYSYTSLASEKVLRYDEEENPVMVVYPELKMNIIGFVAGARLPVGKKFLIDPYLGFRYDNFYTSVKLERLLDTNTRSVSFDFWDPVFGVRVDYFACPRMPMWLKADFGGLGAGSKYSWSATYNVGYSLSPTIDLTAGFSAYGFKFEDETALDNTVSLAQTMYGFDLGLKIILPKRYKDPSIFKKAKKG